MLTATPHAMARILRASFLCLLILFLSDNGISQEMARAYGISPSAPEAKSFAGQYLKRKEMKAYDWENATVVKRQNDTSNILCIIARPIVPNDNELKYILVHCSNNVFTELTEHQIIFADSNTKLQPLSIISRSFVCKSDSEIKLKPSAKESSAFVSQDTCADCQRPFAWVIKGKYSKGKIEKLPPTLFLRLQGALLSVPSSCTSRFPKKSDWIFGWDDFFNPKPQE